MRYIHQRPEWPHFTWDDAKLMPTLLEVRHRQGRLLGRMEGLGFRFRSEAALENLTAEVVKSSAIEGTVFDPASVRSSIARRMGIQDSDNATTNRNVEGAVEMMFDATRKYSEPLTVARLLDWQSSLFPGGRSGMKSVLVGRWRTPEMDPMQVVSGPMGRDTIRRKNIHFEGPPADRLPAEVERFLAWFESTDQTDPVLRAGLAHFYFVTIHPFEDGNGRVSRAIADLALARADGSALRFYSMSTQIESEKKHYYRALEKTQKGTLDITGWLAWFLGCLDRALQGAESSLARIIQKSTTWEWINHHSTINDRQRLVINALLDGSDAELSTSRYAKLSSCSLDTALRDIRLLLNAGVLAPGPGGGRSTRYELQSPPETA
ncbi:MAG: Fic family protein [Candidatus Didemnitutus sp.]|nr:Fic family protein [Candidatus Didemnitutus sp.]